MATVERFRKRPVIVDVMHFTKATATETAEWCRGLVGEDGQRPYLVIATLEGDMLADEGDYIIRGVQGEFYPCKPDVFAQTYEQIA